MAFSDETLDLIKSLISFPTISADSNLDLINFADSYLRACGAETKIFEDPDEDKANLLAVIGPQDVPGIILSGHTDVVPVEGQNWTQNPFTPWVSDGKLFGRGSADMKAFAGLSMALFKSLQGAQLKMPLYLALSYDEEVGCTGVISMIEHLKDITPLPYACVVGEPSMMNVINSHKGIHSFEVTIKGAPSHSSLPHKGAYALKAANKMLNWLYDYAEELQKGPLDTRFEPPFSTLNIGTIEAGNAVNIVPENAKFVFEHRNLPRVNGGQIIDKLMAYAEKNVLPALRKNCSEASITYDVVSDNPALKVMDNNPAETLAYLLAGRNDSGAVSYATEAGLFQSRAGIPTVVCGPGNIEQAHKADEYIEFEQLEAGQAFMNALRSFVVAD